MFDTSAVIQWLKGNSKLTPITDPIAISSITVYELLWTSSKRKLKVKQAVENFITSSTIIDIDYEIAFEGASVKMSLMADGNDKPMADILIASSAKVAGMTLITFDQDFDLIHEVLEFNLRRFSID